MNNRELWSFLFLIGTILLNWPFLDIFSLSLPFYLFSVWGLFILVVAAVITRVTTNRKEDV